MPIDLLKEDFENLVTNCFLTSIFIADVTKILA